FRGVDLATVNRHGAVGDAQSQGAVDGAFDMYGVSDFLRGRQDLPEELHFARAQGATAAFKAEPAKVKTDQLPHGVETQAARHYRVAFEVTGEKPQVGMNIQFGNDFALAEAAARFADVGDAIDHQHGGGWRVGRSEGRRGGEAG